MVHARPNNHWRNYARGRAQQLDIPPWAMQRPSVLHELAHSLMTQLAPKTADHGPEYVLVYRRMIEEHMGEDVRRQLDLKYEEHGVKWGIGSIPPGKITAGSGNST